MKDGIERERKKEKRIRKKRGKSRRISRTDPFVNYMSLLRHKSVGLNVIS